MRKIIRLFENGSVTVFGQRGTGKDVLLGNVIARRKTPYISNMDYGGKYIPLDFKNLSCGENTYKELLSHRIKPWEYPEGLKGNDIYISDVGIYFPSQYCNELNRDYKYLPTFFALSRQVARCNVHINTQALSRPWDKLREQSLNYINTRWCKFIGNLVIMKVRIYERYDTACANIAPFRMKLPLVSKSSDRMAYNLAKTSYTNTHGQISERILVFLNRSRHDTYYFESLLKGENNEDC